MADAGWYPDASDPSSLLYWDGQRWTGDRRSTTEPSAQPPQSAPSQQPATQEQPGAQSQPGAQAQPGAEQWSAPAGQQQWGAATTNEPWRAPAAAQPQQWGSSTTPQQQWGTPPGGAPQQQWGASTSAYQAPTQQPGQPAPWQVSPADQRPPKKRRTLLYVAAAVVVLLVAGLVAWLVWPSSSPPKFTYQGKALASADDTLTSAESSVSALVAKRHGAKSADTRCYYAQQTTPPKGTKKSDVDQSLRCGPVLFVDGDPAQSYLSVATTSTSAKDGKVDLKPQPPAEDADPAAVPAEMKLNRPDGKAAPNGSGGLKVPNPPAADSNVLTSAELGPANPPATLDNAVMVGKDTKVTLTAAGEIARYGAGDDARSAPSGQKLIAFKILYGGGDISGGGSARAALVVGGTPRSVPEASSGEWVIAGVPSSGDATLQLSDAGVTQTLGLPSGKPGANNIQVLTRKHRTSFLLKSFNVPVKISKGSTSAKLTLRGRVSLARIDYWIPGHTTLHASSPKNAILSMNLSYTRSGQSGTFGFDPEIVRLRLPGGRVVAARNVASSGKIDDVFEVPATFTSGTVEITGSEKVSGGITLRVTKTTGFAISIAAG